MSNQDIFDLFSGTTPDPSVVGSRVGSALPTPPPEWATLEEAIAFVRAHLDGGVECPCCNQYARRYKRRFNATMTRSLLWLVRAWEDNGNTWVDVPKHGPRWLVRSNQLPTVRWWGLVKRPPSNDPALKHEGLWCPTQKGVDFAHGRIKVPERAVTFRGVVEDLIGKDVSVRDTLGKKFDYAELMDQ